MTMISEHAPLTPEHAQDPETEPNPKLVLPLGNLSLLDVEVRRGDRQLPNEPNRGFAIERLEGEKPQSPVPIPEALPLTLTARAKDFADRFLAGEFSTKLVEDVHKESYGGGAANFMVYFPVPASKYDKAVASGLVRADIFGEEGKVSQTVPGTEVLGNLVDDDKKRERIEKYYERDGAEVRKGFVNELSALNTRSYGELPGIIEAYDFVDGGKDIRLLNFTETRLSDEQLRQVTNALRSFSDKSGGRLYDKLRTILIVPEDNSALTKSVEDEQGRFDLPYQGESKDDKQTLILSERAFQAPEDRKPRDPRIESYWRNRYNEHLLPNEPEEGPGSPHYNVARWDGERLLAHELDHISLPSNKVPLEGSGPTLYSRFNKREHEAELGALEYIGWKDAEVALDIPEPERQAKIDSWEQQRAAKQEMWARQRGSGEEGQSFNAPLGPHFVTCKELDVTKTLPPRPKYFKIPGSSPEAPEYSDRPLLVEINYRLEPEE